MFPSIMHQSILTKSAKGNTFDIFATEIRKKQIWTTFKLMIYFVIIYLIEPVAMVTANNHKNL